MCDCDNLLVVPLAGKMVEICDLTTFWWSLQPTRWTKIIIIIIILENNNDYNFFF
jgi:hypothetical protein